MPFFRDLRPAPRWAIMLLAVALLAAVLTASVPALRQSVLRSAGRALVAQDPPAKADIIVVSTDAMGVGFIEAADLVKAGFATRVAIFDRRPTRAQRELTRRGLEPLDLKAYSVRILHSLGVTEIEVIPAVVGTVDEGKVLQQWCAANSIHSLLFVSVPDHSRRTRRVLGRALGRHGVTVMVRAARFAEFDPDSWWYSRSGQRTQVVESEKLLMDFLEHPF
jgi:uncharacterized SAM-binding protein YcdF (DUF218 family)